MLIPKLARNCRLPLKIMNTLLLVVAWGLFFLKMPLGTGAPVILGALTVLILACWGLTRLSPRLPRDRLEQLDADVAVAYTLYLGTWLLLPSHFSMSATGWVGLAFSLLGVSLGYVPRNSFMGVRLPSTLASATLWRQTNVVAGRILLPGGWLLVLVSQMGATVFGLALTIVGVVLVVGSLWAVNHYQAQ